MCTLCQSMAKSLNGFFSAYFQFVKFMESGLIYNIRSLSENLFVRAFGELFQNTCQFVRK